VRVDPNYISNLAASVGQSSSLEDRLTNELSSELNVTSLQDNPVAIAQGTKLGSAIARDDSFVQTASGDASLLQVADSTLGEVVNQLTSALSLAVEGGSGTLNSQNFSSIAQQLTGIRDSVLSLANTNYQGQYLFSGSQGSVQPFSVDSSTTPATASYAGDTNLQYVQTPDGQKIQVNVPGSDLFGTGSTGVLGALNQLIADFSDGTTSTTVPADTDALTTALGNLSSSRSILDSSLSRLQSSSTYTQTQVSELTVQQSSLVAADPASVATQLSSAETQHQALLSVISGLGNDNLFSYMK
jgi:flagellar hook-associated protein 3 FlgL